MDQTDSIVDKYEKYLQQKVLTQLLNTQVVFLRFIWKYMDLWNADKPCDSSMDGNKIKVLKVLRYFWKKIVYKS